MPKPSEAKALIVEDGDDLCAAFVKLLKCFILVWRYAAYRYKEDGTLSDAFCAEMKKCVSDARTTTPP